jgi:transforming growth factor-beta-induced protein
MKSVSKVFALIALPVLAASCGAANPRVEARLEESAATKNIVEVAQESGNFKTLLQAATAAGLAETLATTDNLTVFAPTDEAFAKIPPATLEALLRDIPALRDVLTYHVVGAKVPASVAVTLTEATMLNGKKVTVRFDGHDLFINKSKVIVKDIQAKNGIIHVIDTVLMPPVSETNPTKNIVEVLAAAGNFTALLKGLAATGLTDALSNTDNLTIFAPDDAAFTALCGTCDRLLENAYDLRPILKRHVVPARVFSDTFSVIQTLKTLNDSLSLDSSSVKPFTAGPSFAAKFRIKDLKAKNGVIHVIDRPLTTN